MGKNPLSVLVLIAAGLAVACGVGQANPPEPAPPLDPSLATATFAGGCFWCIESAFDGVDGVAAAISGYSGGSEPDPTYRQVSSGRTGHIEAVQVRFDPEKINYRQLLDIFWRQIDPTDDGGQFADRGNQYRTYIWYHDDEQRRLAEETKAALETSGRFDGPIVTRIGPATPFYPAEEYHQDYARKHPTEYKRYRHGSGRTPFLESVWGSDAHNGRPAGAKEGRYVKPTDAELRSRLTRMQYYVTQEEGTEPPFENEYWDNKAEGIYVDVVSGEPLFSSQDKFKSGTGWPSFTRPIEGVKLVEKVDLKLGVPRTELRSPGADSHLGHVFEDGPKPTGMRYCINSASLRFVPKNDLEREGYGEYRKLFEK